MLSDLIRPLKAAFYNTDTTRAIPREDPSEDVGVGVVECGLNAE